MSLVRLAGSMRAVGSSERGLAGAIVDHDVGARVDLRRGGDGDRGAGMPVAAGAAARRVPVRRG
jgi:hypothetical protein